MKKLGCRDMGMDCDYVAKGETNEQIKKEIWAHAEKKHATMFKGLSPEKKKTMTSKMDELLKRPVPARS